LPLPGGVLFGARLAGLGPAVKQGRRRVALFAFDDMERAMQRYLNEMTVLGDLLADPCLRYFPDGAAVLRITLETRSEQRDAYTNEIIVCSEHHDAVLYGLQAEQVAWSMRQGDSLWLCGPLRRRNFRDGVTGRSGTICEIEARQFNILRVEQSYRSPLSAICQGWGFNNGQMDHGLRSPTPVSGRTA
jgi:single-strand DNA-binding protein